jgi:hypothetical protein
MGESKAEAEAKWNAFAAEVAATLLVNFSDDDLKSLLAQKQFRADISTAVKQNLTVEQLLRGRGEDAVDNLIASGITVRDLSEKLSEMANDKYYGPVGKEIASARMKETRELAVRRALKSKCFDLVVTGQKVPVAVYESVLPQAFANLEADPYTQQIFKDAQMQTSSLFFGLGGAASGNAQQEAAAKSAKIKQDEMEAKVQAQQEAQAPAQPAVVPVAFSEPAAQPSVDPMADMYEEMGAEANAKAAHEEKMAKIAEENKKLEAEVAAKKLAYEQAVADKNASIEANKKMLDAKLEAIKAEGAAKVKESEAKLAALSAPVAPAPAPDPAPAAPSALAPSTKPVVFSRERDNGLRLAAWNQNQRAEALAKARAYWADHPESEIKDKRRTAKLVRNVDNYVPNKNDFPGVDTRAVGIKEGVVFSRR